MLSFIDGAVTHIAPEGRVTIKCGDFGFIIDMVAREANSLAYGESVRVHTLPIISQQEGRITCYGFLEEVERDIFVRLLRCPGVGPKVALALLEMGSARLLRAIEEEQAATLTSTQGVGAKTAQRLVLELKGKFREMLGQLPDAAAPLAPQAEATQALVGLGFRENEVLSALAALGKEGVSMATTPVEELLKLVLERLRRS